MDESKKSSRDYARLYRSKINRTIAGVCGGIAEFFNIDPLIVRLIWVISTLFAGAGFIAYIAAVFIIPENPSQEYSQRKKIMSSENSKQWGIILIVVGSVLLLGQLGVVHYFYLRHFQWQTFLAILLVTYGIYLIINRNKNGNRDENTGATDKHKADSAINYSRVSAGKMIGGVCTGLAAYFNLDVTIIRLIWILATLASGGLPIIAYIAAMIIFPYASESRQYETTGGKA